MILLLCLDLLTCWKTLGVPGVITQEDAAWPCRVCMLLECYYFLNSLHWPVGEDDMDNFGVSYIEVAITFEHWSGHRLLTDKVTRLHAMVGRVSLFGPCLLGG